MIGTHLSIGARLLLILILITGGVYPLVVTGIAQLFFPWQANGSLIEQDGKFVGSLLIGQLIDSPAYFWGRPSATLPFPYNAMNSGGSNKSPSNPDWLKLVQVRVNALQAPNSAAHQQLIPVDLVTASASGLDPDISPLAAFYQVPRVAQANQLSEAALDTLITACIQKSTFGILGEPRVNVFQLNRALDQLRTAHGRATPQS
jgi:K+-transporting ATPase ATPase C chain